MRANEVSQPIEIRAVVRSDGTVRWVATIAWTNDQIEDQLPDRTEGSVAGTSIENVIAALEAALAAKVAR